MPRVHGFFTSSLDFLGLQGTNYCLQATVNSYIILASMSSKNTLSKIIWEFLNFVSARGREGQGKGKRKIKNTTAGRLSEWRNQIFRNFLEARAARAFLPRTPPAPAAPSLSPNST